MTEMELRVLEALDVAGVRLCRVDLVGILNATRPGEGIEILPDIDVALDRLAELGWAKSEVIQHPSHHEGCWLRVWWLTWWGSEMAWLEREIKADEAKLIHNKPSVEVELHQVEPEIELHQLEVEVEPELLIYRDPRRRQPPPIKR